MKTITVFSLKAGTGKTTVCLSLAFAARQAGLKVVVADVDPLHCAGATLRDRPEAGSLLIETHAAKLSVLKEACRRNGCDLLIIDTPSTPRADVRQAVEVADLALAVAAPTLLGFAAARATTGLAKRTGARVAVLLNRCPPRPNADGLGFAARAAAALLFGGAPLTRSLLGRRPAYHHAFADQEGVSESSPWRAFANDVQALLAETAGELFWEKRARSGPTLPQTPSRAAYVEGPPAGALPAGPAEPPRAEVPLEAWERVDDDFQIPKPHAWRVTRPTEANYQPTAAAA